MSKKFAFLFPGQGAQYVGMGKDFYDHFPVARHTFEEANDLLKCNFSTLIFEGPSAELTLTKNSQPAIYIVSMAILRTFQGQFPHLKPSVCAGLSLGEYTALAASSRISFSSCLSLVKARGQYMQDACVSLPGTMLVVLGLEPDAVESALRRMPLPSQAWVANLNCPGQVVVALALGAVQSVTEHLKASGAKRVLPLDVSGAFHSPLMKDAQEKLQPLILESCLSESPVDLVMNTPGDYVRALDEVRHFLIEQVTNPVRWEKGIRAICHRGVDVYLEMGCGKTLAGMNKKIGVTEPTFTIEKIADLDEFSKQQDVLCNSR